MTKAEAEKEKTEYAHLLSKKLIHKKYPEEVKIIEMGISETTPESKTHFVFCQLKGELGSARVSLDYVLKFYNVCD